MAANIASGTTAAVLSLMQGASGINASLLALQQAGSPGGGFAATVQVTAQNVAPDLVERSTAMRYPTANIYCEKVVNTLKEKFRSFSGRVEMVMEIRHSQDGLEGLESALELYTDAASQALDATRGDWGNGMFYSGGYEITFGAVKRGGRGFVQSARIGFDVGVSKS
ncbi:MAG TPA: hypothetical protein VME43_32000 [Bryobacteraceae bacterium]|nr:hypothetical protein [Bryobacteraceae bacterium]